MKKYILNNGITLIYEHREGSITSFCIGFEAGAAMDFDHKIGMAHAVEHMLFKGTSKRNEYEINEQCDKLFGFNNAMTNYPYAIYYGTSLSADFEAGFELYSDIILNPIFPEEGFNEEKHIILEELRDWSDDAVQYCEDMLQYNAFKTRRINERIIGTDTSIKAIEIHDLKLFYDKYYKPDNCVIGVVSSLSFNEVLEIALKYFGSWEGKRQRLICKDIEENIHGTFTNEFKGTKGAKIQYCFPIHDLSSEEEGALMVFNLIFGEGSSSILFDEIRTKRGLAYEVFSRPRFEKGIKLLDVYVSTSEHNIEKVISTIDAIIEKAKVNCSFISEDLLKINIKRLKLKRELRLEKSIEFCKAMTTREIMFNNSESLQEELKEIDNIKLEDVKAVINKVFRNPSIQIIKP